MHMNIQELTHHPENLNQETLYELRRITALYPYYQLARLLLIKNLYLLHDPSFDDELRRASIYFTDRKVLFDLVESAHYRLRAAQQAEQQEEDVPADGQEAASAGQSRTVSLIDSFLNTMPLEPNEGNGDTAGGQMTKGRHRKPTAADATIDYVAYLVESDFEELDDIQPAEEAPHNESKAMNGGELIDSFLNKECGRITLQETVEYTPEMQSADNPEGEPEEEFLTETLAGIYIKQGNFRRALDIMTRINENNPKKNPYYEDQKRFLTKLIANQRHSERSKA